MVFKTTVEMKDKNVTILRYHKQIEESYSEESVAEEPLGIFILNEVEVPFQYFIAN